MKNKKNKNVNLGLKKNFTKFAFVGKRYLLVNWKFYLSLLINLENISKKIRKSLFRRLAKKRLVVNYRNFLSLKIQEMDTAVDYNNLKTINTVEYVYNGSVDRFFFRFVYPLMISLCYYKITENQLELIRRLARKMFGKRCFIKLLIVASVNILKRPNQMRMGGGKGSKFSKKVYFLYPGAFIFELRGVLNRNLKRFNLKLSKKIPFAYNIVLLNRI